jgi:RNA polymerase sigma-70 factor (ECF subfamily)
MAELPAEQREALILVGAGGFAYEEAAEICGCAVGTVKSRVSRARKAVQTILEAGHYRRDGRSAGEAMGQILSEAERLSAAR